MQNRTERERATGDRPIPMIAPSVTEFDTPHSECSYLPSETASLKYRQWSTMSMSEYDAYLARGWRRHGVMFFRPNCPACLQCRSMRLVLEEFQATKSQRRCLKKNDDIRVQIGRPQVTAAHLDLFNRYHQAMHLKKGWPNRPCDSTEYVSAFLIGEFDFAFEFQYLRDDRLLGVGLVDMTHHASSSVYFYHAPEWRAQGPGVFSMLSEIRFAAANGLRHHYLGYWIAKCASMSYKSNYRPHQVLETYVADDEQPVWRSPNAPTNR